MSRFENSGRDRNFDDLAARFSRNVYASLKGRIRLEVLKRDLLEFLPGLQAGGALSVLDAGAGQGHFAVELARMGHRVVLNDISAEMLVLARARLEEEGNAGLAERVGILQQPLQKLGDCFDSNQFDLVVCHAVIEWLAEPRAVFDSLLPLLKPGGYFSLLFYNFHGLEYKNLLRTNFSNFNKAEFKAFRGSLTPIHPQTPEQVQQWVGEHDLEMVCKSGVRVFHDYILNRQEREREPEQLLQKELEYSRREPFWRLGRYVHFLCCKPH